MSAFINTADVIGDDALTDQIIMRTVTEYKDERVLTVVNFVFYNCQNLTEVSLPNVTSVGGYAFGLCANLKIADFSGCTAVPTLIGTDAFSNTHADLVIKVPAALLDEWKAATNWSYYADKIVGV